MPLGGNHIGLASGPPLTATDTMFAVDTTETSNLSAIYQNPATRVWKRGDVQRPSHTTGEVVKLPLYQTEVTTIYAHRLYFGSERIKANRSLICCVFNLPLNAGMMRDLPLALPPLVIIAMMNWSVSSWLLSLSVQSSGDTADCSLIKSGPSPLPPRPWHRAQLAAKSFAPLAALL